MEVLGQVARDMEQLIAEWLETDYLHDGDIFVVGCSTSEVLGEHIGTSGSEEVAEIIFQKLYMLKEKTGISLAFQCCEHLNRAIVVERETMKEQRLDEVSVIPVPTAGGSMASYAFKMMKDAVVVEDIKAKAGMDIGETMIGMHLAKVAVPLRFKQKEIGSAHVSGANTRPKLIGGERANYVNTRKNSTCN